MKERIVSVFVAACIGTSLGACEADLSEDELAQLEGAIGSEEDESEQLEAVNFLDEEADELDSEGIGPQGESLVEAEFEVKTSDDVTSAEQLTCTQNNDCRVNFCECDQGVCVPDGFSPSPPPGYCDQPPERSCASVSDCRSGCSCLSGVCSQTNSYPDKGCHLPPPDKYEQDDWSSAYSPYTGTPQVHNFDKANDVDWVAVYFASAATARFETRNLKNGADTKLRVYEFGGLQKGNLLAEHDDVSNVWWFPDAKRSKIEFQVPKNSLYIVEVSNQGNGSVFDNGDQWPEYTLEIKAL